MTPWKNKLYYGDNLRIMREYISDESVDLIYLDPPFNSKTTYNVLFREKNGSDRGVDGYMYFIDYESRQAKKVVIQVKSGHVSAPQIRDLKGAVDREKAVIGVFITLQEPTGPMKTEAAAAGFYETEITASHRVMRYPRAQILTIEELLAGKCVEYPQWAEETTIKKAARIRKKGNESDQPKLL